MHKGNRIVVLEKCPIPGGEGAYLQPGTTGTINYVSLDGTTVVAVWDFPDEWNTLVKRNGPASLSIYLKHLKWLKIP